MNKFYVYIWYEKDSPIYVGKGCGKRAYRDKKYDVEIYLDNLSEKEAFNVETELITRIGRKDKGEGPLLNLTDGGGIAWSTLYWKGEPLKKTFEEAIQKRDSKPGWIEGARKRALIATKKRHPTWQDWKYELTTPDDERLLLSTTELKAYCTDRGLSFNQLKEICRNGKPTIRGRHKNYMLTVVQEGGGGSGKTKNI